jgi:hypothetical protein
MSPKKTPHARTRARKSCFDFETENGKIKNAGK